MKDEPQIDQPWYIQHLLPLAISALALVVALGGDSAFTLFRYQPSAISEWEVWRLLSGHLAHLGWSHLIMNLLGLGLIWGLFWNTFTPLPWLAITIISSLTISFGLYWLNPNIIWYVGLSGVLHGLFVAGALGGIRRGDRREAILLVAIVGKLLWEQVYGPLPGTADMAGGPVITEAHLYGAIGGAIAALIFKPRMWC